ncbi:uncharacterized protein HKW66_Vig0245000 [Vigna angularis]|uniref:Uncharacterized protein n=1 Tax=Phaseolus angularis TaxID=3914 RepID=A0A8T0L376_PHAAN|nr:uncharacterized protein HKW66_Vig0245000 [Vigna angularis]
MKSNYESSLLAAIRFSREEKIPCKSEPVILEFPELKGHAHRDYWLAIIQEILYVHKFISKYGIKGIAQDEVLWKVVLGILRLQAIQDISSPISVQNDALLMFNLRDEVQFY